MPVNRSKPKAPDSHMPRAASDTVVFDSSNKALFGAVSSNFSRFSIQILGKERLAFSQIYEKLRLNSLDVSTHNRHWGPVQLEDLIKNAKQGTASAFQAEKTKLLGAEPDKKDLDAFKAKRDELRDLIKKEGQYSTPARAARRDLVGVTKESFGPGVRTGDVKSYLAKEKEFKRKQKKFDAMLSGLRKLQESAPSALADVVSASGEKIDLFLAAYPSDQLYASYPSYRTEIAVFFRGMTEPPSKRKDLKQAELEWGESLEATALQIREILEKGAGRDGYSFKFGVQHYNDKICSVKVPAGIPSLVLLAPEKQLAKLSSPLTGFIKIFFEGDSQPDYGGNSFEIQSLPHFKAGK